MILIGPPVLVLGVSSLYLKDPEILPFSIFFCIMGAVSTLYWVSRDFVTLPKIKKRIKNMKSVLQNLMNLKETELLVEESAVPDDHNHIYEPKNVLKHLESIQSGDTLKFYAARKGIVREGQGVRIIEPLVALDAPTSMDLNASVLNTHKTKV